MGRRATQSRKSKSASGGQKRFARIEEPRIARSKFDRTHGLKTAFNVAELVPIFVDEAIPGDTFSLRATTFGRLATPINPVMENLYLDTFYFSVPCRLVWDNWEKFMGAQENPDDSTDFLVPQLASGAFGFVNGGIFDYMGIPTLQPNTSVNALHMRAYNLIYNEYFRSQDLQDSLTVHKHDGPELATDGDYGLRKRGKRHDYFTSALPWPQKGPAVTLGLGGSADVTVTSLNIVPDSPFQPTFDYLSETNQGLDAYADGGGTPAALKLEGATSAGAGTNVTWNNPALGGTGVGTADLASATAATVNELREAITLQQLYERDARAGTRYTEVIRGHFGVDSPDARLQRPEFLGGSSQMININPVAQTSETQGPGTPQGNLAAFGMVAGSAGGFTQSFTEHCLLIGLAMVRADLNYQQGLNRMWSRRTRWDYYWPTLANLGEQEIKNKEIYLQGDDVIGSEGPVDDEVFGYQERYAEYRYKPSGVTGPMRSNFETPLDSWHLAQDFASLPTLNGDFIEESPPIERILAVPSEDHILLDMHFKLICARPMPIYATPGLTRL